MSMYHAGNRSFQDAFDSRPMADRLEELSRKAFSEEDKSFIESAGYFFLATADSDARPDCSFKGGPPGFVRVVSPDVLVFPDYDGNGMFKSLGNIKSNSAVALLFVALGETPRRLRVNGDAEVVFDDPLIPEFPGAQLVVRVKVRYIFPNCPRYIPNLSTQTPSIYLPKKDTPPIEPAWKSMDVFKDVVPPRRV